MCESFDKKSEENVSQNKFSIKKVLRKQMRCLSLLEKHENIKLNDFKTITNSRNLLIGNAGIMCEVSYEELFKVMSSYGSVNDILLIPQKPYALIRFETNCEAFNARNDLNLNFCKELNKQLIVAFISDEVWIQVFNNNKQTIDYYCSLFIETPNGLNLVKEFISPEEENQLLLFTTKLFKDCDYESKSCMKNRLVKHFGFEFDYLTNNIDSNKPIESIPNECQPILNRLLQQKLISEIPDQLTINNYSPGHGIPTHTDTHSMCENGIISLSIGSDIVMQFKNPENKRQSNVLVPQRSALIMNDESRYLWTHCITPSKSDIFISNAKQRLTLIHRKRRISLTFRKVKRTPCECPFIKYCDSRKKLNEMNEEIETDFNKANNLEKKYVHEVYDSIASHFSDTRYKPWPKVAHFLNSLPIGSLVLDVGCGNGKYLNVNPNIAVIGCDRSQQLLKICREKNYEVFVSDCLQLSVRNGFDACICIAVLHHLSSNERRIKALQSIIDLLSVNGKALIYVWAFEQRKDGKSSQYLKKNSHFSNNTQVHCDLNIAVHQNGTQFQRQDLFVPWKTSKTDQIDEHLRYYHVFKEGELEKLVNMLSNVKLLDIYYDQGNWSAVIQRV